MTDTVGAYDAQAGLLAAKYESASAELCMGPSSSSFSAALASWLSTSAPPNVRPPRLTMAPSRDE